MRNLCLLVLTAKFENLNFVKKKKTYYKAIKLAKACKCRYLLKTLWEPNSHCTCLKREG